eukprot:3756973-Pyramimonas_sp.AAC.1
MARKFAMLLGPRIAGELSADPSAALADSSARSGHAQWSAQVQSPRVVTARARSPLKCPSSFPTNDVYRATNVQQSSQRPIDHGPAVRC